MFEYFKQKLGSLMVESLNRDIYSSKEAQLEQLKKSSQTSTQDNIESSYISYDPFSNYTSNIFSEVEKLKTQNDMILKWRAAALTAEVDEALEDICNEAIIYDEEAQVIGINLEDIEISQNIKDKISDSFEKIMYLLDFNERGDELFRQWYVDGVLTLESVYNNSKIKDGIQKLILLSPFNLFKYKDKRDGVLKYFYCKNASYNLVKDIDKADQVFLEDQVTQINSGIWDLGKQLPLSSLHKSMKILNQLNLIEDSLIIFRITRSPEKRVFYIDTGNLPKGKAEEYVQGLIAKFRQKRIYNTDTGTVENKSKQISILEDFWFPTQSGGNGTSRGTKVETLQGQNPGFNSFEDVDYFVNKLYKSLGVPLSRKDKDSRLQIGSGIDIEREELKFFKKIVKLRRKFNNLFVDLLKKDLLSRGIMSLSDWSLIQEKIKFDYANSNEFSTLKKLQMMDIKIASANSAAQLLQDKLLSVEYIQTAVLGLTEDERKAIEKSNKENSAESEEQEEQEEPEQPEMKPADSEKAEDKVSDEAESESSDAGENKPMPKLKRKKKLPESILDNLKDGDILTNGNDKVKFEYGVFKRI